jgi:hypothetical protein
MDFLGLDEIRFEERLTALLEYYRASEAASREPEEEEFEALPADKFEGSNDGN